MAGASILIASIKSANVASRYIAESAGFRGVSEADDVAIYQRVGVAL